MHEDTYPFPQHVGPSRAMVFVDGENLTMRYRAALGGDEPFPWVAYERDVFVWAGSLNMARHTKCDVIRRYYYTSARGDEHRRHEVHDKLKDLGVDAPRVFPRSKGRGSKQVDISLAVDMLGHAHRHNYDVAVLVAGDEDYIPLVDAVMAEGCRVVLWSLENGLSAKLRRRCDHWFKLELVLLNKLAPTLFG